MPKGIEESELEGVVGRGAKNKILDVPVSSTVQSIVDIEARITERHRIFKSQGNRGIRYTRNVVTRRYHRIITDVRVKYRIFIHGRVYRDVRCLFACEPSR